MAHGQQEPEGIRTRRPRLTSGLSVRAKAVLAAAGTVAFAIALCMLALVLALQHNLRASADLDARNAAVAIKGQLGNARAMPQRAYIVAAPGQVTIRDASGRTVTPTAPTDTASQGPPGLSRLPTEPTEPSESAESAESAEPTEPVQAGRPYSVTVSPSTTSLDSATGLLLRQAAPAAAGLVLFVAGLTWLLVGRALRPVAAMRREFTEITERDLHRRVPVPRARDEIHRLARTMNATLDRLHRAMTRQRQFVADASHELRSPIAAVRAQLELVLARPSRTDWPAAVHKALRDTDRLQAVASDLLLLARLDAQEAPPKAAVDLGALAAEEVRRHPGTLTMDQPTTAGGHQPKTAGGDQPTTAGGHPTTAGDRLTKSGNRDRAAVVTGSRVQLSRLLTNLADNARRHTRSSVSISVAVRGGMVELAVDDDGPGIPESDRERVFERFTRLDDARARQDGGTGLGLAIANDIAHAHGGTLTVLTSPRGGARLLLRLPRAA
ncbi:sensor histidine kinase [Streptomyces rapamycinicus]|uniref:histidine kinase n=1 Tax=Streptomyces rapamycinicus TaxID=1226757 RepID=A0ABR6LU00_9ACTN|nr:HAMP domain-containing sensor histidine kinase [Streptomyces rapamycinicus]MBB4785694.1 signal transduction histidine kinase [Streptomyces rapamycinicus]UTO65855.1 HAMP domain-containing histidine kinase [Streptomyces rapamycinicus]UTP33810.1 HAMP domain-containing histidine kinase [Streptomyces rapamycinicus NRRL 5491]